MQTDALVLSDVGLHAINNASAGGVLVNAVRFKLGSSRQNPKGTAITDIQGATLFSGNIHHVEVLNKNVARFVFEVKSQFIEADTEVNEVGIYLADNILLGRAVFGAPMVLVANETVRFNCLLVTNRCDLTTLNVTVGDYSGLASTPYVFQLQSPHESSVNAVTVLNGLRNIDGSDTPVIAMRYSAGSFQWAFTDHTRVFNGRPSGVTSNTVTIGGLTLEEDEIVLVHVVSGSGSGATRRYQNKAGTLRELDNQPIPGLSTSSTVVVWKPVFAPGAMGSACQYPPNGDNIPSDWVLVRGTGDCPKYAPQKTASANSASLYMPPSKLRFDLINYTGSGDRARYALGNLELDNVNFIQPNLGGVMQHRGAFDMLGNEIEFTEYLPVGLPLELRMFSRTASNGSRMIVKIDHVVGDGVTQRFKISQPVENANYIKIYIRGVCQFSTTFVYDAATQEIELVAPIATGMAAELRSFSFEESEGYSTDILTHVFTPRDDTQFIELPFFPQSVEYVEISQSGSHVHANLYTLIGNKIVLSGSLRRNTEVEVVCYDNRRSLGSSSSNLPGVVVDAVLSGHSLKLLRHAMPPVSLPIPGVSLKQGPGIRITGKHPFYTIESTLNDQLTDAGANFKMSDYRTLEDATEIIFTHRVNLSRDLLLTVHADFIAVLGPGFQTVEGLELAEYVVGFRTSRSHEVDYGRQLPGTGNAGFNSIAGGVNDRAYANASMTQVYDVIAANHQAGYIDVVVKMRIKNANIGQYSSLLTLNVNILGSAKVTQ